MAGIAVAAAGGSLAVGRNLARGSGAGCPVASQVQAITQIGITDIALRQKVEMVRELKPAEMEGGYTVKCAGAPRAIAFDWAKEYRTAKNASGVVASAKAQLEEYRGKGVPGWLIDAIDNVPPVAQALSVVLLLTPPANSITVARHGARARHLKPEDLALVGVLLVSSWWRRLDLTWSAQRGQASLAAALALALAVIAWRRTSAASTPPRQRDQALASGRRA